MMKSIVIIVACLFMTLIHQYFKPSWCPHWFWGQFFWGDINSLLIHRWWMFQANRVRLARPYHSALELFKLGEEEISRSQNYEVKFLGDITDQLWPSRENRKRETSAIWRYHGSTCENRKRETSTIWRYHASTSLTETRICNICQHREFNILIVTWIQYSVYI